MKPIAGLFLSAFSICTAEFIVAGLLPAIAAELDVDISTAGLLITGYALCVAIISPIIALLTGRVPRRSLLVAVLVFFVAGNISCAMAPSYWMLLGSRMLVAGCHGLFFGVAFALALSAAPNERQTQAVSLIIAGVSMASVLGVPIGAAIGQAFGWRTTFWVIAAAGAAAAIAVAVLVPGRSDQRETKSNIGSDIRSALRVPVVLGYGALAFFIMGALGLYTYLVPLLTAVSGVRGDHIPLVLFGMGFCGVFGNLIGGWLGDKRPFATMIGVLTSFAIAIFALGFFATSTWIAVVLILACWFVGYAFPAPIQARILKDASDAPTLASTLSSTATHLGIAAGAALGAVALDAGWPYRSLPLMAGVAELVALAMVVTLVVYARKQLLVPAIPA
jgi:DHA1 family inner membrane transport protein